MMCVYVLCRAAIYLLTASSSMSGYYRVGCAVSNSTATHRETNTSRVSDFKSEAIPPRKYSYFAPTQGHQLQCQQNPCSCSEMNCRSYKESAVELAFLLADFHLCCYHESIIIDSIELLRGSGYRHS